MVKTKKNVHKDKFYNYAYIKKLPFSADTEIFLPVSISSDFCIQKFLLHFRNNAEVSGFFLVAIAKLIL